MAWFLNHLLSFPPSLEAPPFVWVHANGAPRCGLLVTVYQSSSLWLVTALPLTWPRGRSAAYLPSPPSLPHDLLLGHVFFILLLVLVAQSSDSVTPWSVARQAPLSTGFFRQDYWSGLPFPSPGDRPNPGTEPRSPASQADSFPLEPRGKLILLGNQYFFPEY